MCLERADFALAEDADKGGKGSVNGVVGQPMTPLAQARQLAARLARAIVYKARRSRGDKERKGNGVYLYLSSFSSPSLSLSSLSLLTRFSYL